MVKATSFLQILIIIGATSCTLSFASESKGSESFIRWRTAYIIGNYDEKRIDIHESEKGFRELRHLMLAVLEQSHVVGQCCTQGKDPKKRSLMLRPREALYLSDPLNTPLLIEHLQMMWEDNRTLHVVVNKQYELKPRGSDPNIALLAEWLRLSTTTY